MASFKRDKVFRVFLQPVDVDCLMQVVQPDRRLLSDLCFKAVHVAPDGIRELKGQVSAQR